METIKEYLLKCYGIEELKDIVEHGCVEGAASQHIYYKDTVAFHDKFEEEIWDMLYEGAKEFTDSGNIMDFIAGFAGSNYIGCIDQFKNLLCWYTIEHIAQEILDEQENKN